MQYMQLGRVEQQSLLRDLAGMVDLLETTFAHLSPTDAARPGPEGSFSPVEHCWHLADLEREGYGIRIRRLLSEDDPMLADFDGARVAAQRNYKTLALTDGIEAFRSARTENLAVLRNVSESDWKRPGRQEGVGRMALCDVPGMMAQHDSGHRQEIQAWVLAFDRFRSGR